MRTVVLISQIFILLFIFVPTLRAEFDSRITETHFATVAEQLKEGYSTQEFADAMKIRFRSPDDAKFLDELARRTPRIEVQAALGTGDGITVTTIAGKKIEIKTEKGKIWLGGRVFEMSEVKTAKQFMARVDSYLVAARVSKFDLFLPRAVAIAPVPLLAGAVAVYAGSEIYSAFYPYTLDAYLIDLTQTCDRERKRKRAFEGSKTAIALRVMTQKHLVEEKSVNPKMSCEKSVQKMLEISQAERVREGELTKTCEAKQKFIECVRAFRNEHHRDSSAPSQKPGSLSR
jgi:hypothetical protein